MNNNIITVNGKKYTLSNEADFVYRSHINGMSCLEPNNWVACDCTDENGTEYTAWYYVTEEEAQEENWDLSWIDYGDPDDIVNENGKLVYCKES